VTLTNERDISTLREGLEHWLGRPVGEIRRPAPGWSCETLVVEGELVIRLPPLGEGIFPTYDLAQQAAVQDAVHRCGVPTAAPVRYEPDPAFLGAPFISMPFVRGPIPQEFTSGDPWLRSLGEYAQRSVWRSFLDTVCDVHAVKVTGLGATVTSLDLRCGIDADVAFWESYLSWANDGEPLPALTEALGWCLANQPVDQPANALLWGDVRLGNVVFDETTLTPKAVLDWDMASFGPIEMDIAWFVALEQLQRDLSGMALAGFGGRGETIRILANRIGRELCDLEWYEIYALVRASAVSTRIAILFERAGKRSMFKIGEDPALLAATKRIAESHR